MRKRGIKFRAWSTKFNKFMAEGFHIIGEVILFNLLNQHSLEELNTLKIQEWTSFKDENGKDIYEGDILACSDSSITGKWPVGFANGCFVLDEIDLLEEYIMEDNILELVVVGNIFENPELLNE